MWLILQHSIADDFVLATNEMHTVREFVERSFKLKGFNIAWRGSGINEVGYDTLTGRILIRVSEKYFRPAEVELLIGDATKAEKVLGWRPKITFDKLIEEMVNFN
jgi:GDPmannose 4,6-dehydratase